MTMSLGAQNLEDVKFIASEIVRFIEMAAADRKSFLKENPFDGLCLLPHPSGTGQLICGQAAHQRFYDLANRALATDPRLSGRTSTEELRKAIVDEFVFRFLKKGNQIDQRGVDKMVAAAAKKVRGLHKIKTHFIPCTIFFHTAPDQFRVGAVLFTSRQRFLLDHKGDLEDHREQIFRDHRQRCEEAVKKGFRADRIATEAHSRQLADHLVNEALDFFGDHRWIASVVIPPCDDATSELRANATIEAALNAIRVRFGEYHSAKIRRATTPYHNKEAAKLTRDEKGKFEISLSGSEADGELYENWHDGLRISEEFLHLAAQAIEVARDPAETSHLKQRYVDALSWYGQGVLDPNPAGKIGKYSKAMERIVIGTRRDSDIQKVVCHRVAHLNFDHAERDWKERYEEAKRVYEKRSALEHGDLSPFEKEILNIAALSERVARRTLLHSLFLFATLAQRNSNSKAKELEAFWLERFGSADTDAKAP